MELFAARKAAADAAGISKDTWQRVEDGETVRESTYAKIDRALGWSTGSCVAVAEGGEPILADRSVITPDAPPPLPADAVRRAVFEAARAKLPLAAIGDLDAFSDELVEVFRRVGMVKDGG